MQNRENTLQVKSTVSYSEFTGVCIIMAISKVKRYKGFFFITLR